MAKELKKLVSSLAEMEIKDQIELANQWGTTTSWHGRMMYSSPEDACKWNREQWLTFAVAVGATLAYVLDNPHLYGGREIGRLRKFFAWTTKKSLGLDPLVDAARYTLDNLDSAAKDGLIKAPKWFQAQLGESAKGLRKALDSQ